MSSILFRLRALIARKARKDDKGQAIVEFGILAGLVAGIALMAVTFFGEEVDYAMCRATNALGGVTGYINEDCYEEPLTPEELGYDPTGFVDLYLYQSEVEKRRVLLPVKNFDIKGLSEVIVETDREDSVAACYRLEGGQVTCASMQGLASAFTFPPNVVAVGYEILPVADPRIEMAQPVSITLGSIDNPSLNKTWNITVFRPAEPNVFDPDLNFASIEFPAGTIGEQRIVELLKGKFSKEDLIFNIDPSADPTLKDAETAEGGSPTVGSGTPSEKGEFGICDRASPYSKMRCGLIQAGPSIVTIPAQGVSLGYEFFLPRDVRKPVSWPMTISLASSFDAEAKKTWEIVVSRVPGEAPVFHDLPFTDIEFEADTAGWDYSVVELDQSYPSDLLVKIPQSDPGLKACYQMRAEGGFNCSSDAGDGEVEFTVPAGAYSVGLGVNLPEDVLTPFERRAAFEVQSVDYPDQTKAFDLAITRPEFVVIFEPVIVFEDIEYPMGTVGWQTELVDMAGIFNSDQLLVLPEGQPNGGVCSQGSEEAPDAPVSCAASDEHGAEVSVVVSYGAKQIGFQANLGESEFQPVDEVISFELRNAKDPSFMEAYSVRVTRPASPIVFEPDTASMSFLDMAYPEAAENWQEPQMVPLKGNFNTDLLLKMAGGLVDAGLCFQESAQSKPQCGSSALDTAQELLVPKGSYAIGFRPRLSSDIHIEQDLLLAMDLVSAEGGEGVASFSARATRPAVPVKFDPNLGFRDKVFEKGTTKEQHVFVPIEGEITTGLKMIVPQVDYDLRACYQAQKGDKPACVGPASYGEVVLEVPRNSATVGYRVVLPNDVHVDWMKDVAFRVVSDYDETLDYDVAINVSRETIPVAFAPTTDFGDVEFPAGTTGTQEVLKALTGDITTKARVVIPVAGLPVFPCVQKVPGAPASCGKDAITSDQSHQATWTKEEEEGGDRYIHGAGFRVALPDDIHKAFDKSFTFRLVSQYDPSKSRDYRIRITRPAVDVVWRPDASLKLPDAEFPARTAGSRDFVIPFAGSFTTATDYTIGETQRAISPCSVKDEGGKTECGSTTESAASTITLEPDFSGIGYRVELPSDLAQEVDKTVQVDLRSAYDPSLFRTQTFRVYREPAPVVFSPTVSFENRTFENAETGWQRDMERLSGELTTNLELFAKGGKEMKLCVQDAAGEEPRCTTQPAPSEKKIDVAPTAHAIGYEVRLPDDPSPENRQTVSFELRMVEFPSQRQQYDVSTYRKSLEDLGITFKPTISFGNETLEIAQHGWFTFMEPLTGEFSSDIELLARGADENLKLCIQVVEGGAVSCDKVPASGAKPIDRSVFAIGYSVNVPDEEFVPFKRTVALRLQPVDAPSVGKDYNPTVTRPERAVELPRNGLFESPKVFQEAEAGYRDVMVQLEGVGNTPMRFEMAKAEFDIRPCIQLTAQSPVTCPAEPAMYEAKSYAIDSETFAIGYRVRLPQDPFDKFDRSVSMSVRSETVEGKSVSYNVALKRPVQMPIMPAEDMFTNRQYPPGTTGTKTIMAKLDPRIDTPLKFSKGSGHTDLALCYQRSYNGPVSCEGEGQFGAFEIIDADQSWYAAGYRFTLDENPDNDVFRTLPLRMTSTRVSSATVAYNVGISRMIMNAVMPDRTFFPDVTYPEGDTGSKLEMQQIGDDVNIDLVLHKAAGQPGLEICYQEYSSWSIKCSGAGVDGAYSISVKQSWYAMGYRFSVGGSKFSPFDETFNLHLTARDGWSNRVDYAVSASRPHVPMVLPAADLFTDILLEDGDTGVNYHWVKVSPEVNTNLEFVKAAGQPNLSVCRRPAEGGRVYCAGDGDANEVVHNTYMSDFEIGFRFNAGASVFEGYQETFNFVLRSSDLKTEKVTYRVTATRPAREVMMPAADAFIDVTFPEGTTGTQFVSTETAGAMNANFIISGGPQSHYYNFCMQRDGSSAYCNSGMSPNGGGSATVATSYDRYGIRFNLPTSKYAKFDETVTFTVTSSVDETKSIDYTIRLYRPASEIKLPPVDFFTDVALPEGTVNGQFIMKSLAGHINTTMQLYNTRDDKAYGLCRSYEGRTSPYCPVATDPNYARSLAFYPSDMEVGIRVPLPSSKYEGYDDTLDFSLFSVEDDKARRDYSIRITRPGVEIKVPPANLFSDVAIPEGTTGQHYVMAAIQQHINSGMEFYIPPQSTSFYVCRDYPSVSTPFCPTYSVTSSERTAAFYESDTHVGYRVSLPSNVYQDYDETITFTLRSREDRTKAQSYAVRITRPGVEIKVPPANLFSDVVIPEGTTGQHFVMAAIQEHINSGMEFYIPPQSTSFYVCRDYPSVDTPYCPTYSVSSSSKTAAFYESDTRVGYKVNLPSNVYQDYDETITFTLRSREDRTKAQSYTVRITRPGVEIKVPPANLFSDVVVPEGTTGQHYVMAAIQQHINSGMEFYIPPQSTSFYVCRDYPSVSTPFCPTYSVSSSAKTADFFESDTHVGYRVSLPSNIYQDYDETITFTLRSREDRTKAQSYTVRITRPSAEVTMPSQALFQDVILPAGSTGMQEVVKTVTDQMNTKVYLTMPRHDYSTFVCAKYFETGNIACSANSANGPASLTLDPSVDELVLRVYPPGNEFDAFDKRARFTLTSAEDSTKTVSYDIRVQREDIEITMPAATLFQDVVLPAGSTGMQEVVKTVTGKMNTTVYLTMPRHDYSTYVCAKYVESGNMACSANAANGPASLTIGASVDELVLRVFAPGNEFDAFDKRARFTLTSAEDSTKTVSYDIRVQREDIEITMPAATLFQDVILPAGSTGMQEVVKTVTGKMNTAVYLTMPRHDYSTYVCAKYFETGKMDCSANSANGPASLTLGASVDELVLRVFAPGNEFDAFDKRARFTLTSAEDSTKTVSYDIRVQREDIEITMPAPTLFEDIVFAAGTTGLQEVRKNVTGQMNTGVSLTMPQHGFSTYACVFYPNGSCSANAANGPTSLSISPSAQELAYRVVLPNDTTIAFDEIVNIKLTSVEDSTKTVSYQVRVQRPAAP